MNRLASIPVWAWYLFSVAYCYALWNPWFSLSQLLSSDTDASVKVFFTVLALIVGSLYIVEGHRTLNTFAIILFVALFGSILWFAFQQGFHGFSSAHLWGQWIVGLLLTIALQGGRIYRTITGRVPVGTIINSDGDHHHHN